MVLKVLSMERRLHIPWSAGFEWPRLALQFLSMEGAASSSLVRKEAWLALLNKVLMHSGFKLGCNTSTSFVGCGSWGHLILGARQMTFTFVPWNRLGLPPQMEVSVLACKVEVC